MTTKINQDAEMTKRPTEAKPQPVEARPTAPPNTFRAVLRRAKTFADPARPTEAISFSEREAWYFLPSWVRETNTFKHGVGDGSILLVEEA